MSCCDRKKSRWKLVVWLAIMLGVASLAVLSDAFGDVSPTDPDTSAKNAMCPVMTDEPVDPEISTTYNGREVYFCCKRCKRQFERDPEAYVDNLPAGYFAVSVAGSGGSGHPHDHADHEMPAASEAASSEATADIDDGAAADGEQGHTHPSSSAIGDDRPAGHDHADHSSSAEAARPSATTGGDGHDHSAHEHGEPKGFFARFIAWLGNFHPPSVNFPVALMTAALVAEGLFMATGRPLFDHAGRFTVWFAIVGTVGAVVLGWFFGGFKLVDDDWIMTTHRWVGTAAGLWAFVLAWFAAKAWSGSKTDEGLSPHRNGYRVALIVAVLLVNANGFLGGALIYGIDHYLWKG